MKKERLDSRTRRYRIGKFVSYHSRLASSAAGYAALTITLADVFAVPTQISRLLRMGWVATSIAVTVDWSLGMRAKKDGTDSVAVKIAPKSSWLDITIFVLNAEKKHTSSTSGMVQCETGALLGYRKSVHHGVRNVQSVQESRFRDFGTLMMRDSNQFIDMSGYVSSRVLLDGRFT